MRVRRELLSLLLLVIAGPALAQTYSNGQISGDYIEYRTADVYTGPCFANAEMGLTGQEAVLAWRIQNGTWNNVALDGLSVVAVVRARATLGDPYANPLPAKAVLIIDTRASEAQRAALADFAQAQTAGLLSNVVAIESSPIRFEIERDGRHGHAAVEAGSMVKLATRAIGSADHICRNEEIFYQPLAVHLNHSMPVVAAESSYRGNHLGITWNESDRRSSFVGTFSL
jgi:hypothetical protein